MRRRQTAKTELNLSTAKYIGRLPFTQKSNKTHPRTICCHLHTNNPQLSFSIASITVNLKTSQPTILPLSSLFCLIYHFKLLWTLLLNQVFVSQHVLVSAPCFALSLSMASYVLGQKHWHIDHHNCRHKWCQNTITNMVTKFNTKALTYWSS